MKRVLRPVYQQRNTKKTSCVYARDFTFLCVVIKAFIYTELKLEYYCFCQSLRITKKEKED